MRAVAYIRVSDASQVEGHSLEAQERAFREHCRLKGWEPVRVYREEGKSAHVDAIRKRPAFRQLLDDAGKRQFDVVLVHTFDRWARNLRVGLEALSILGQNNVGLVSISENLDYSTPHGKLATQMLGAFAEYYSEALATHVKKGVSERARQGKHLGGVPFGYMPCSQDDGKACDPEHPGGVHVVPQEAEAIAELFRRYAPGNVTVSSLASWLNNQGFRTRNTKHLSDGRGGEMGGPRLFTTSSVRGILHNPFYAGMIRHGENLLPGAHEAIITEDAFHTVTATLKRNSGRSETLQARPEREYLLKGIIRCAHCLMPMWAQTLNSGNPYYREQARARSHMDCPADGKSIRCDVADEQISRLMEAIVLPESWMDRVLAQVHMKDEVEQVRKEREQTEQRLKRLGRAYVDGLLAEMDYLREKQSLQDKLASLVVPGLSETEAAGRLLEDLPRLWQGASLNEKRRVLLSLLDAVYVDTVEEKRIVAIKSKPAFRPLLEILTLRPECGIILVVQPQLGFETPGADTPCFWWRRGGVERYRKHALLRWSSRWANPSLNSEPGLMAAA